MRSIGKIGKNKTAKNEHKLAKISINSEKFSFFGKNEKKLVLFSN